MSANGTLTAQAGTFEVGTNTVTGGAADSLLNVAAQTATLAGHVFPACWTGGECNVRLNTSGTLTMSSATGAFVGDTNDCDSVNGRGGVTGSGIVSWGARMPRPAGSSGYPAMY